LYSQRRTQLRESREGGTNPQPSSVSGASSVEDRGFHASGRRGSFDHVYNAATTASADHVPAGHKVLSSSISTASASRIGTLEHQTSGGTLVQRSVVRGRHKKGLDIVGESEQVEGEEDNYTFSPNAFGTPVSEFASGASTPMQRAASVGLHDGDSGFSPSSSVSAVKGHELMRKTASASISPAQTFVEPKDADTRSFLQGILSQHYLFSSLAPAALDEVINAMQSIPVASGEIVVKEGDIVHNAFYVVQRGMFDIYGSHSSAAFDALASTKSSTPRSAAVDGAKPVFLTSICAGGTFGEAALMYSAPADLTVRAAAISATNASTIGPSSARSFGSLDFDESKTKPLATLPLNSALTTPRATGEHLDVEEVMRSPRASCLQLDVDATAKHSSMSVFSAMISSPPIRPQVARDSAEHLLWRLDRRTFRKALTAFSSKNAATIQEALRSISLFKPLTSGQLAKLGYAVREEHFNKGYKIITKGSPGDAMYFLLSGEVVCTNIGSGAIAIADVPLKTGACFGERALLLEEPRAADVIVTSETATVLTLDRLGVTQLLGPLQELIYKNMVIGALRSIPTFSAMAEADLDKLASCARVATCTRGQKIVDAKEASSCMYIVREGTARVSESCPGAVCGAPAHCLSIAGRG
jgi:CRP-like cAMP-binding protein